MNYNFIWPIEDQWNHYNVSYCSVKTSSRTSNCTKQSMEFNDDLINLHNHEYAMKSMSMSRAISETIEYKLTEIGAQKGFYFLKKYRPIQYLEKTQANCNRVYFRPSRWNSLKVE